jgi:hypothetical protein
VGVIKRVNNGTFNPVDMSNEFDDAIVPFSTKLLTNANNRPNEYNKINKFSIQPYNYNHLIFSTKIQKHFQNLNFLIHISNTNANMLNF